MKKKGATDFLPTVLVKLVFAVGLILLISWLLVSIYTSIFGSENKTEKDNFNTLFNLIESKSKSSESYSSSKLTIYLIKTKGVPGILTTDHTIHFFPANKDYISCKDGENIYRPSSCDVKDKPCLCLYDSDPDRAKDEADDDVIICKQFSNNFNIDNKDFQLVKYDNDCLRAVDTEYINLIVGVQNYKNRRVFVWLNNEENRVLDEKLTKKICPDKTGLCSGIRDGDIITDLKKVNDACKSKDYFYSQAKCVLEKDKCKIECTGTKCDTIKTCSDFNINSDFYIKNSTQEYFCNNNACNKQCIGSSIEQYTCIKGKENDCKELLTNIKIPGFVSNCSIIIGDFSELTNNNINYQNAKILQLGDIISFDSKKQNSNNYNCKGEIEKYFKKNNIFVCKEGVNCNDFVSKNPPKEIENIITKCEINPFRAAGTIVITRKNSCIDIEPYFTQAYSCSDKKIERFI